MARHWSRLGGGQGGVGLRAWRGSLQVVWPAAAAPTAPAPLPARVPPLPQIRREVEVQLAGQVQQAQAEQRRAAREAARLEAQLQHQSAQVQAVAARKEQAASHK